MSLKQAVVAVAAEMEEYAGGIAEAIVARGILGFARQLRTACLAAGDGSLPAMPDSPGMQDYNAWLANAALIKKDAERAARAAEVNRRAKLEEGLGERLVELVGAEDGPVTYHAVPPDMPVGAFTQVGDTVYQLHTDGRLHAHAGR